jgi:hypothetical protein
MLIGEELEHQIQLPNLSAQQHVGSIFYMPGPVQDPAGGVTEQTMCPSPTL